MVHKTGIIFRFIHVLCLALSVVACKSATRNDLDHLRLAVPYEIETLDPHARNKLSSLAVVSSFYEPLVRTDNSMMIRPCLAEYWENPDSLTWIFHLRKGIHFFSGKPLEAGDVVFSFNRLLTSKGLEISGYVSNIANVRAKDRMTVEIQTSRPSAILLNKVSCVSIIPDQSDPARLKDHPEGTGPYRLADWKPGVSIRMVRNSSYWGNRPAITEAEMLLGRGSKEALDLLQRRECRFVQCNSKKLEPYMQNRKDMKIVRSDSLYVKFLAFNFANGPVPGFDQNPFLDVRVRRAIHLAIDRPALVSHLDAPAVPASQPVPPFTFGFNSHITIPNRDLKQAKDLLRDAGFENGFQTPLLGRKLFENAAIQVKDQLKEIGIEVQLKILPDPEFFQEIRAGRFALYLSRFGCPTGDASDILDYTLHTIDPAHHYGGQNYGGYSNPQLDMEIEKSGEILDMDRRRKRLQGIMTLLMDDLVWVPLYVDQDAYAFDKRYTWEPRNDSVILVADIGQAR